MGLADLAKKFLERRTRISPDDLRKSIPVRNPLIEVGEESEDGIVLRCPLDLAGNGLMAKVAKARKIETVKQYELDPVGSFVWGLCDGKTTFEGISLRLREEFRMKRVEADAALGAYLQTLAQRKLITLMVKGQK